MIKVVFTQC